MIHDQLLPSLFECFTPGIILFLVIGYCRSVRGKLPLTNQGIKEFDQELEELEQETITHSEKQNNQRPGERLTPRCDCQAKLAKDDHQQEEKKISSTFPWQSVVSKLSQLGFAGTELSEIIEEATKLVAQTLEVEYCKVLELLPNGSTLLLRAGVGWQKRLITSLTQGVQGSSLAAYTLQSEQPVIIEDLHLETRFRGSPLLYNHKVISGVSVVIPGKDRPFGILGAYTKKRRTFTEDEASFLQAIANVLATAVKRQQAEAQLHLFERAIKASSNGIVISDALESDSPIIYANPSFERMTGYSFEEVEGKNCRFLQACDRDQQAITEIRTALAEARDCYAVLRNYRQDGTLFWNELYIAPVHNAQGHLTHFIGIQNDITERKLAEEALRHSEERFRNLVEITSDWVWELDENAVYTYASPQVSNLLGYQPAEILGKTPFDLMPLEEANRLAEIFTYISEQPNPFECLEKTNTHKEGHLVIIESSGVPFFDQEGKFRGYHGIDRDITERKRMEEQLRYDALHDSLTGLPNRALFMKRLKLALKRTQQEKDFLFAVLFLDLDRFKVINDSVGHMLGDQLLKAIANRLNLCLYHKDTLARLGGDEFIILLNEITSVQEATDFAEEINRQLTSPFSLNGHEVFSTASIGIATNDLGYEQPEDLLRDADIAMYRAKERGPAHYQVFDQQMHANASRRMQIETDLRRALTSEEFRVYYQPIISLTTGRLTGFEALVRWQHPQRGLVSPAEFIPVAEETGLIVPIGLWILREACRKMGKWQKHWSEQGKLTVSVNLSGKQVTEPGLIEQIDRIIKETGFDSKCLKLEITESILMDNTTAATNMLWQLRARNILLCLDDFGTGYSSLSYLHRFPVSTLKIDRSFVSRMSVGDENLEIVRAIVTLAHTLKMDVIAEGVETAEQFTLLKLLGCEQGQGYFYSRPLAAKATEELIALSPKW
ncbi:MAG: EAL domain-containing protein [Coleofasciculaceae cyanobacterium]